MNNPFDEWPNLRTYEYYGRREMDAWKSKFESEIVEAFDHKERLDVVILRLHEYRDLANIGGWKRDLGVEDILQEIISLAMGKA